MSTGQKGKKIMKKILWFFKPEMTEEHRNALKECENIQINRTINSGFELQYEIRTEK